MPAPVWTRSLARPRLRRSALVAVGASALAGAAVIGFVLAPDHAPPPVVTVVPMPALVAAPAPVASVELSIEESIEQREPVPGMERAGTPMVNGWCLVVDQDSDPPPSCSWDAGFPAISADGRRVATRYTIDDGGRGNPNLWIHILDVRTSRVVEELLVLSPDEYDHDDRAALAVTVERRATAAQRVLDAGGYRTLDWLGALPADQDEPDDTWPVVPGTVHAEIDGDRVRAIDRADHRVVWQHRFAAPAPTSIDPVTNPDFCSGWDVYDSSVWWDPATRVVVVTQTYRTGGCLCSDVLVEHVKRMP